CALPIWVASCSENRKETSSRKPAPIAHASSSCRGISRASLEGECSPSTRSIQRPVGRISDLLPFVVPGFLQDGSHPEDLAFDLAQGGLHVGVERTRIEQQQLHVCEQNRQRLGQLVPQMGDCFTLVGHRCLSRGMGSARK